MDLARLVTVETYGSVAAARLAQGRLEAAGIDAVLIDEYLAAMLPLCPTALGGVKLQVREADERAARGPDRSRRGNSGEQGPLPGL